ncbi:hypothetical protein ACFFYR_34245 [Paraburkholderia dipogonis]
MTAELRRDLRAVLVDDTRAQISLAAVSIDDALVNPLTHARRSKDK